MRVPQLCHYVPQTFQYVKWGKQIVITMVLVFLRLLFLNLKLRLPTDVGPNSRNMNYGKHGMVSERNMTIHEPYHGR